MSTIPVMWVLWAAMLLVFIVFRVYISRISRNEDDRLILQESSNHVLAEQQAISARLQKARPVNYTVTALFSLMTIYVAGYYLMDMLRQFR